MICSVTVQVWKSGCCDSLSLWKSWFLKDLAVSWHCARGSVGMKQFLEMSVSVFDVPTTVRQEQTPSIFYIPVSSAVLFVTL